MQLLGHVVILCFILCFIHSMFHFLRDHHATCFFLFLFLFLFFKQLPYFTLPAARHKRSSFSIFSPTPVIFLVILL